jgi:predicted secreted Zn-dependent protease
VKRKVGAAVGAIISGVVITALVVGGINAGSSRSVEAPPTEVAVATPEASVAPAAKPTSVVTPERPKSPVVVDTKVPTTISTAALPKMVRLPKLTPKVKGATKVKYIGVRGESPAALLDDVVMRSKPHCKEADTLACVFQRPSVRWTERTRLATGACTIVAPKVSSKATVFLPRWVSPKRVQPELVSWWKKMVHHMSWHEAQHIKIQKTYNAKLKTLMVGKSCSSANKIFKKWERSLKAAQDKFDAKDAKWAYPVYTGPGGFYGTL